MASSINASTSGVGGIIATPDNSGDLNLQSGGSTKVAITSSGVALTGLSKASLPTGSVLQVVNGTYATETSFTSTSYVTANLTATITPTSATSKILIIMSMPCMAVATSGQIYATVFRGTVAGTNLASGANGFGVLYNTGGSIQSVISCTTLDSPATTSATTYTVGVKMSSGTGYYSVNNTTSTITLMEIAA